MIDKGVSGKTLCKISVCLLSLSLSSGTATAALQYKAGVGSSDGISMFFNTSWELLKYFGFQSCFHSLLFFTISIAFVLSFSSDNSAL